MKKQNINYTGVSGITKEFVTQIEMEAKEEEEKLILAITTGLREERDTELYSIPKIKE